MGSSPSTLNQTPRPKVFLDEHRILPCGHSFCGPKSDDNCLLKLEKRQEIPGEIKCPMCQRVHEIQAANVPSPYGFEEFLEDMAKMRLCERHNCELKYFCYDDNEEICDTCWKNQHRDHKIELIEIAKWKQLCSPWERRMLSELREFCLESAEALSKGVDYLVGKKKRYIKIADLCLSLHQKQSKIDDQFQKKQLDPTDKDVAEFELYVNHIKEESKKLEEDMKKMDEMSAELKRITIKTGEELKKRQGEDLRVKKEVAPAKQLPSTSTVELVGNKPEAKPTVPVPIDAPSPSTSTAPAVRDRLAANVPNVQLNRAVQDSNLLFAPYGLSGLLAGSRAENSFGPTHFSRYREDLNTPRALAPPLENFTAPTVRNRVFQAANVPSVQLNSPVPATDTIIAFGDWGKNEILRKGTNKWTKWTKRRDCGLGYACVN